MKRLRSVRGGKPLLRRRGRNIILLLTLILVTQVVIYQIANGRANALISLLSRGGAAQISANVPPPTALASTTSFPLITGRASAMALSPDDKRLAVSGASSQRNVAIWDIAAQRVTNTLSWSGATPPTSIAWSADGTRLAAADGSQITIWNLSSGATLWQLSLPAAPSMRVYDVEQQLIVGRPNPASAFNSGALVWGADGALNNAPPGALGPIGVSTPQAPVVGMWSSAGSHIFAGDAGVALVGSSSTDTKRGVALLDWSPGGRYLLWGALTQPIAVGGAANAKTASRPPDSVVGQLATTIAKAGSAAGAVVWFAPVGQLVALCDQSTTGAHIQIVEIATGRVRYQLAETCDGLSAHSALWTSTGKAFYVIPPKGPIEVYTIPA